MQRTGRSAVFPRQTLGRENSKLQIVAVSAGPRGDKAGSAARFRARLASAWSARNAGSQKVGVSGTGRLMTIYPANFESRSSVHELPRLAASQG